MKTKENFKIEFGCIITDKNTLIEKGKRVDIFDTKKIKYLKAEYNGVIIFLIDSCQFYTSDTLSSIEARLPDYFYRINKSEIINLHYIISVQDNSIALTTSEHFIISRRKYKGLIKQLKNILPILG